MTADNFPVTSIQFSRDVRRCRCVIGFPCLLGLLLVAITGWVTEGAEVGLAAEPLAKTSQVELECEAITESSGLAAARRPTGWLFTHNDSGDTPRLFALDAAGRHQGEWTVPDARAIDWEDMSSIRWQGAPALLLADVGDNNLDRTSYQLYVVSEPSTAREPVRLLRTITFRYPDGPHDCEAVAVDVTRGEILLVVKQWPFRSHVYRLRITAVGSEARPVEAEHLTAVPIPLVTGMDISSRGDQMVLVNYFSLYVYARQPAETWEQALSRNPRSQPAPARKQGEAVAYSNDGRFLYLTSEGRPTPLLCLEPLSP